MTLFNDENHPGLQYLTADSIHSGNIVAVFSARNGGVSGQTPDTECYRSLNLQYHTAKDSYDNVYQNYEIITSSLGFSPQDVVSVNQKHTDRIITVDKPPAQSSKPGGIGEAADALVTNIPGVLLSVRTADCVPILLYDCVNRAVAAVHSGWRGTFKQIAVKALGCMTERYGSNPADIQAAIGPSIGLCCFEVGLELLEQFRSGFGKRIDTFFEMKPGSKPHCDLKSMNKAFLLEAGVPESNIEVSDLCTMCNPELFFSHRRSGFNRGAMAAFIGMR